MVNLTHLYNILHFFFPALTFRKETSDKFIWLTFDDGPDPIVTPFILDILQKEKIKATFFLIGEKIKKYPKLYQNIIDSGHIIGNHSYSHKNGWLCKNKEYFYDIEKCQTFMPHNTLFRPPYGKISPSQIKQIKKKYKIILWDVLSWDFSSNINANKVYKNVILSCKKGSIIVFHNQSNAFNNLECVLSKTIKELKRSGFKFSIAW